MIESRETSRCPADLLTQKRSATLRDFPLQGGARLAEARVGYETYGEPNAARDNAVLVCHYFSGSSHAAGRYTPADPLPGWWDAVIGPGKAIDTRHWYVIAIDALGCVRRDAPHGVTSGPASQNPATGRPYGPDFPPIAIADMVESQRRMLDQLGVGRLAAVAGPSLGAMQALEWAVRRPNDVARVIAAIGLPALAPREHGIYQAMANAIRLDPAFGRAGESPRAGLAIALKLMTVLAGSPELPGAPDPASGGYEAWLDREVQARVALCDPYAWHALLRTNMGWKLGGVALEEAVRRITARVLLLPSPDDALLPGDRYHDPLAAALAAAGVAHEVAVLPAGDGHLAGLTRIGEVAGAIRACLEAPL